MTSSSTASELIKAATSQFGVISSYTKHHHEFVAHDSNRHWQFSKDAAQPVQYECPDDEKAGIAIKPNDARDGWGTVAVGDTRIYGYLQHGASTALMSKITTVNRGIQFQYRLHVLDLSKRQESI